MTKITIDKRAFSCSLRYSSRRRSVQIRVSDPEHLEIAAPTGFPEIKIRKLVESKQGWILKQVQRLVNIAANPANASLTHGATVLFKGAPHSLLLLADGHGTPHVTYSNCAIAVHLSELVSQDSHPDVCRSLKKWYVAQSYDSLLARTRHWATQIGVNPCRISLRDQKTRWGSCSSKGSVIYNWRIIMAPPEVLDYLVVHELCHMLHPNHSQAFWREVAAYIPDYGIHRRWLRQNGSLLNKILSL